MSYREFVRLARGELPGALVEIPETISERVIVRNCDICGIDLGQNSNYLDLRISQRAGNHAQVGIDACRACLAAMIPDPVKAIIASFGLSVDFGPGASP